MSKSHDVTTRAVVVARAQSGEGSARVFLYSEEFGLVGALAKSAREERSQLRPHLQVGTYGSYTVVKGSYGWRITGAIDTVNTYFSLANNEPAQRAHARILSVVRQLVHGEEKNHDLFETLWNFTEALPRIKQEHLKIGEYSAALRMLFALGYVAEARDLPALSEHRFTEEALEALIPHERALVKTINDALLASNLT